MVLRSDIHGLVISAHTSDDAMVQLDRTKVQRLLDPAAPSQIMQLTTPRPELSKYGLVLGTFGC